MRWLLRISRSVEPSFSGDNVLKRIFADATPLEASPWSLRLHFLRLRRQRLLSRRASRGDDLRLHKRGRAD
jgi:hypothetical protein